MAPLNTDPAFEQFQSVPDIRGIIQYRTGCLNFEHEIYAGNVTGDGKVDLFVWLASQYAVGQKLQYPENVHGLVCIEMRVDFIGIFLTDLIIGKGVGD